MKLLIIEDQAELLANVQAYLNRGDVVCEAAASYQEAEDRLRSFAYDIVLLDLMLPDGNGLDLLRLLKRLSPETGVLIISAKNALDDRIKGLELGADDYLTKPFHLSELNARLNAIYRRRKFQGHRVLDFGLIAVDTDTREVTVSGEPITLTLKEYELMLFFITNQSRVLTKQAIAEHLWGDDVDMLDSFDFVYQHIKNLRKKIAIDGCEEYIKTVYGLGYKLSLR